MASDTAAYIFFLFTLTVVIVVMLAGAGELDSLARRWRQYWRVLVEDVRALASWSRMTRAHLRAVRKLMREMERQSDGDRRG